MRFLGVCTLRRAPRLALLLLLAFSGVAAGAGSAAAATWTGGGASTNWSAAANWSPAAAPTSPATLSFPQLSGTACPLPTGPACVSVNDLGGLTVSQLQIDAADNYDITGNPITLTGGLTTLTGSDQGGQATLGVPITVGAPQTWTLEALSTGMPDYLILDSALSGNNALTVNIGNHNSLALNGDNEIGPLTVTGADPTLGCNNGGIDLRNGGSLNANGNPVTLTNTGLQTVGAGGSVGALTSNASCLVLGNLTLPTGSLSATSATFDSSSSVDFRVYGAGNVGGSDYAQLTSTGAINLGGAQLVITNRSDSPSCTSPPPPGPTPFTFVSTTGALTGTFGNAPNGGTILDGCPGSLYEYVVAYTPHSVTATLIKAPTTALTHTPASAHTNQTVTLQATIAANGGTSAGTVNFEAGGVTIPGCGAVPVSAAVATCQTSFAAAPSPVALSAFFTQAGSVQAAPVPGTDTLTVTKASTSAAVAVSTGLPVAGSNVTYTATVTPAPDGPTQPSGSVEFRDGGKQIGSCPSQALKAGASASTATCKLSYPSPGVHTITAIYAGDGNFTGSTSPDKRVTAVGKPTLSRGSIHGVGKRSARLAFTATAGMLAPQLKTIEIAPSAGIIFSSAKDVFVKLASGKRLKFKARVIRGTLRITLRVGAGKVKISVGRRSIVISRRLAAKANKKNLKSVKCGVAVTDLGHMKTKLTLKLPVR